MKLDAQEWRRLRSEFIEAAAKYDEYETFIERNERSEDWYCNNSRYLPVGLIRWPYGPYRKCWILVPDSGTAEEPFSTMKTLFNKAWLWLPRDIADKVVDTAESHLSKPPSAPFGTELFWAKSDYQYWCWLLWFHGLRQQRAANPSEAENPLQKMILAPFHRSADLIAQWGLDGGDGTLPEWLAPNLPLDDGLYPDERCFVWGGARYDRLTDKMVEVLRKFVDQRKKGFPIVRVDSFNPPFDGGFIRQAFKQNRQGKPQIHEVAEVIEKVANGEYRLIDPGIKNRKVPE